MGKMAREIVEEREKREEAERDVKRRERERDHFKEEVNISRLHEEGKEHHEREMRVKLETALLKARVELAGCVTREEAKKMAEKRVKEVWEIVRENAARSVRAVVGYAGEIVMEREREWREREREWERRGSRRYVH